MDDKTTELPTGYVPTALPVYTEMDDGGFEQFCTDLLNLHPSISCLREGNVTTRRIVSANRLLSGTSQKGADIRADAERGEVWFFQCKHTKEFGPADVTDAVELAETSLPQADQFVLITTCGLSEAAQAKLHERRKWLWWDASHLTIEVLKLRPREEAINLVHRYFAPNWKKLLFSSSNHPLLSWKLFFSQELSPDKKHFHHRLSYVMWTDALSQLESFARVGAGKALILSAAGGQGKSRLLMELARNLETQAGAPRVRFLNLNRSGLTPDQSDFLAREDGDLLLIVDDAHRLDSAIEDVANVSSMTNSVRLLISTRPQAVEAITSQLYRSGYAERLESPLILPRWKPEEIHTLAEQVLSPENRVQAPRLAALADRCPLLVVMGGALINSGNWPESLTNEVAFRERVFLSFREDFLSRQPEGHRAALDRLIKVISFVSPTSRNDQLVTKLAEILNCSPLDVADGLDRLQTAGILVENREGIRLYPDLFADAVILEASLHQSGEVSTLCRTILEKLPTSDFPALMRNLAQADWEARTRRGALCSLFDPVWLEFIRRFETGVWVDSYEDFTAWICERYAETGPKIERAHRGELLSQWASFSAYLPERTIELVELALRTDESSGLTHTREARTQIYSRLSNILPSLLLPIVIWHPSHAIRALDLLWQFDAEEPKGNRQDSSKAIEAIADAASFDLHRPLAVVETVLGWLEHQVQLPATIERFRQRPWIIAALLKPFFGREAELNWSTGKVLHCSSVFLSAAKTRPIRQRALDLAKRFIESGDVRLCNAIIPVFGEAVEPIRGRFGSEPTKEASDAWRPDRLEAIKVFETVASNQEQSPAVLLHLRKILRNRSEFESDEAIRAECERLLTKMPNTFELQMARILTSHAHDEAHLKPGPDFELDLKEAERKWAELSASVARIAVERFVTAHELCSFVRTLILELKSENAPVHGSPLLESVAKISPEWCVSILKELIAATDTSLDRFLFSILHQATQTAPATYQNVIKSLVVDARAEHLSALISFLGWKHLHGGGLAETERLALVEATTRRDEGVEYSLATVAGHHFSNDEKLAIEILTNVVPSAERVADEVLEALARSVQGPDEILNPAHVEQCLANMGAYCFPETTSDERSLERIAKKFPKQVYEHIRRLYERWESDPTKRDVLKAPETMSLGPMKDADYVDREIRVLWRKVISSEPNTFAQSYPMALIRSLLWSNEQSRERILHFVENSNNPKELLVAARLAATRGSRFVFQYPDLVRAFLTRAESLNSFPDVNEVLWLSACGGGRTFSDHELDPEYRYILEQGDALANRYIHDPHLNRFYRMIADSERKDLEGHRRRFAEDELD